MSDEWGILPIPTSPQMRINILILQGSKADEQRKFFFSKADAKKTEKEVIWPFI